MSNKSIIAPSILACKWEKFGEEIKEVSAAGADWIHIDVMDGHFVPPITFGPGIVKAARISTDITLDVHLMIEHPERQVEAFADAGANIITVHQEACKDLKAVVELIKHHGVKAGVSIKPDTPVDVLKNIISDVDLVLIMTVEPGWGGQKYIIECTDKIKKTRKLIEGSGKEIYLEVDGGINDQTVDTARDAGANVFVAGSYVFGSSNYKDRINSLRV